MRDIANDQRTFFRQSVAGVYVITTVDESGVPVGFTASSVASVSLDPPVLAFSLQKDSSSANAVLASRRVAVHALGEHQGSTAAQFAAKGIDRFAGIQWQWSTAPADFIAVPILDGVNAWVTASLLSIAHVGDSQLVLCQLEGTHISAAATAPLAYSQRNYCRVTKI